MEQIVTIPCGDIQLEGRLERSNAESGVIITHPHPLYGGDMQNPVVEAITRAYSNNGYSTLRFNFRGAGASGGDFDDGRGEQLDILACIDYLKSEGIEVKDLAGYSFGAWVLAKLSPLPDGVKRMLMVAPPVAFMDFSGMKPLPPGTRIITGSVDDFAPPPEVGKWLAGQGASLGMAIIEGADHFFSGRLSELETAVFEETGL